MLWANINTGFFHIHWFKFQFFMRKDVLKGLQLLLGHIHNSQFRNSLRNHGADFLHTAFLMFDHILLSLFFVKIRQQPGDHITGICSKAEFFPMIMISHGYDQPCIVQNILCILLHGLSIRRDPDSFSCPLK